MAENDKVDGVEPDEPQGEQADTTDWKAEARKWEQRAKKWEAANTELELIKAANMSEQEREKARADKAEQELAAIKAENERLAAARRIAEKTDVPLSLLEYCSDEAAMESFAKEYAASRPVVHTAASANPSHIQKTDGKAANRDKFAAAVEHMFK